MTNSMRDRIAAAFDSELADAPVPPALRSLAVRAAVQSRRQEAGHPRLLAALAAVIAIALLATLVVGSHLLNQTRVPAHSPVPPAPRVGAAVAYDQARGTMVLFGGSTGGGNESVTVNETWTWDGSYWTQQHPRTSPPRSRDGVMAYDQARHDVVLFLRSAPNGTWTWNGSTWQLKHPVHVPPLGYAWQGPVLQFDPITRAVLLYGFNTTNQPQTWSWNGSDWTRLQPATSPNTMAVMAFDGHQVLLLAQTPGQIGGRYFTQTWAWDGSSWNLLHPRVNLPLIGWGSTAYDAAHGQLVLLTGDTWTWDGSSWARQHPTAWPATVGYMVYMASRHEVVTWADVSTNTDGEMYGWDGTSWKLLQPGPRPETTNGKGGYLGPMSADQAAAIVRASVTNTHPVLLPNSFPGAPYDVRMVHADADGFDITYEGDLRDKSISFGVVVANPPPGPSNASETWVKFRNAVAVKGQAKGYADYFVYDPTSPLSQRWLMWIEPGTIVNPMAKAQGVPYFLSTDGLTDAEFWQVANSLR
jgi:hypothetical protein